MGRNTRIIMTEEEILWRKWTEKSAEIKLSIFYRMRRNRFREVRWQN